MLCLLLIIVSDNLLCSLNGLVIWLVMQLLREISHENVVKLVNVHINHPDMSLFLAFDYAEHDLYVSTHLPYDAFKISLHVR